MGSCHSNTGKFEPPGARSVADFVYEYDKIAAELRSEVRKAAVRPLVVEVPTNPSCSMCMSYVEVIVDPWQRTRDDLLSLKISGNAQNNDEISEADRRRKLKNPGIKLKPCHHVFCGPCLAGAIYRNLNVPFHPSTYGTIFAPSPIAPLAGRMNFPMGCPSCIVKPDEDMIEIGDTTARMVLGNGNMDEWNQARFMWTQDILYLLADERRRSRRLQ